MRTPKPVTAKGGPISGHASLEDTNTSSTAEDVEITPSRRSNPKHNVDSIRLLASFQGIEATWKELTVIRTIEERALQFAEALGEREVIALAVTLPDDKMERVLRTVWGEQGNTEFVQRLSYAEDIPDAKVRAAGVAKRILSQDSLLNGPNNSSEDTMWPIVIRGIASYERLEESKLIFNSRFRNLGLTTRHAQDVQNAIFDQNNYVIPSAKDAKELLMNLERPGGEITETRNVKNVFRTQNEGVAEHLHDSMLEHGAPVYLAMRLLGIVGDLITVDYVTERPLGEGDWRYFCNLASNYEALAPQRKEDAEHLSSLFPAFNFNDKQKCFTGDQIEKLEASPGILTDYVRSKDWSSGALDELTGSLCHSINTSYAGQQAYGDTGDTKPATTFTLLTTPPPEGRDGAWARTALEGFIHDPRTLDYLHAEASRNSEDVHPSRSDIQKKLKHILG